MRPFLYLRSIRFYVGKRVETVLNGGTIKGEQ